MRALWDCSYRSVNFLIKFCHDHAFKPEVLINPPNTVAVRLPKRRRYPKHNGISIHI